MMHNLNPDDPWFTSDLHFGHNAVLDHCNRPYADMDAMTQHFTYIWNWKIHPQDRVYVVGDFSFHKAEATSKLLESLNGHKVLVKGNHDASKILAKVKGWMEVVDYKELRLGDDKVVLSHFPFMSWNKMHHGSYHLHGHSHGSLKYPDALKDARILDVGVDNIFQKTGVYRPIRWSEVKEHLRDRRRASVDHHVVNENREPF